MSDEEQQGGSGGEEQQEEVSENSNELPSEQVDTRRVKVNLSQQEFEEEEEEIVKIEIPSDDFQAKEEEHDNQASTSAVGADQSLSEESDTEMEYSSSLDILQKLLANHEDITDFPSLLSMDSVAENDDLEFWLVQCPKDLEPQSLVNQKIDLTQQSRMKAKNLAGQDIKLESHIDASPQDSVACLIKATRRLHAVTVPIAGTMLITRKSKTLDVHPEENFVTAFGGPKQKIPFPEGLKIRHPQLGLIKHEENVRQSSRVKVKVEPPPTPVKENKLKRSRKGKEVEEVHEESPKRKKRRRGASPELEVTEVVVALNDEDDAESTSSKKKKNRKSART